MQKWLTKHGRLKERIITSVSIEADHIDRLDARAAKAGVSRSGVLRDILDQVLSPDAEADTPKLAGIR
jgi:metal-responsive CopG/Arc/MetJ family transcriptional regulator